MRSNRLPTAALLLACPLWITACDTAPSASTDADAPAAVAEPMTGSDPNAAQAPADAHRTAGQAPAPQGRGEGASASSGDTSARIERLLGDVEQYEAVFDGFKTAVVANDRSTVVDYLRFPLNVGEGRTVADAAAFLRDYETIVTPEVVDAVAAQQFGDLFVNQDGVMIGRGQVWLNSTCLDDDCTRTDVRVVAIQ